MATEATLTYHGDESDEEFMDGLSPHVIHHPDRQGAVANILHRYGKRHGAPYTVIALAQSEAKLMLAKGHSSHRALEAGERVIDLGVTAELTSNVGC